MKKAKIKSIDCVELKNRIQEKIYRKTKNLSPTEEIAYYKKSASTGPLGEWWVRVTTNKPQTKKWP